MIKKITGVALFATIALTAMPAFAQTSTPTGTPPMDRKPEKVTVDVACLKTAIDARESALATAATTFGSAWASAVSARGTALKAAWDLTGKDRMAALKKAATNFASAKRAARQAFEKARSKAWSDFKAAAKVCHAPSGDSSSNAGGDTL